MLVFHGLNLSLEDQVAFLPAPRRGGPLRRQASPGVRHLPDHPGQVEGTRPRTTLQAAFIWHIDGCTPTHDECPQKATVLSAVQVANAAARPSSPAPTTPTTRCRTPRRSGSRRCGWCIRWRRHNDDVTPDPRRSNWPAGGPGRRTRTRWSGRTATAKVVGARCIHRTTSSEWTSTRGRALLAELLDRATEPARCTATPGRSATRSSGTTRVCCTAPHRTEPNSAREMLRTTVLGDEPIQ